MMKFYRTLKVKSTRYALIVLTVLSSTIALAQDTTVTLIEADGPGETYDLLASALGGSPLEVPDCDHEDSFQHIEEVFDETLSKNVFKFYIHKDIDTDRCETNVDRQRNEIKAYDPSPDALKGIRSEVVTYEWYFRIDEGFQPSANFTHLFQLKAVGGTDDANPVFTITPRKGDPDQLELIHGRGNNGYTTVGQTDLAQLKGKWVKAYCKVIYAEDTGSMDFNLTLLDGTEVISYLDEEIDLWRTGSTFVRPKWGIYRSLNDKTSLRDETVLFADFKVTEIGACPPWYEDADADGLGDPNSVVFACERPEGYVQNDVDTCTDWFADADGDGLGDPDVTMYSCAEPEGYVENDDDTDDTKSDLPLSVLSGQGMRGIFPNPATQQLHLAGYPENTDLFVYDLGGKMLKRGKGKTVDISDLRSGIYVLKTSSGATYRFIKSR